MERRGFLLGLGASGIGVRGAVAQTAGRVYRLGLFHVGPDHVPPSLHGIREGLAVLGYDSGTSPASRVSAVLAGQNTRLDWRNLPSETAALAVAREFVRDRVDLIVAFEAQTVRAAKMATTQIPVVFLHVGDPVADGYVRSLSRPGGNLTGFAGVGNVPGKEIEFFKELVPRLRRLLVLSIPDDPGERRVLPEVRRAATALKIEAVERPVSRDPAAIRRVFETLAPGEVDGIFMASSDLRGTWAGLVLALATERGIPLAGHRAELVARGALFCYADDYRAIGRAAAGRYIDRILKGARPADLPVEEVSEFELVVNLRTASALGLTIPPSVRARANRVIE